MKEPKPQILIESCSRKPCKQCLCRFRLQEGLSNIHNSYQHPIQFASLENVFQLRCRSLFSFECNQRFFDEYFPGLNETFALKLCKRAFEKIGFRIVFDIFSIFGYHQANNFLFQIASCINSFPKSILNFIFEQPN